MPKISDIQETPNPNAVKFILRESVSNGVARQFASADQAQGDPLSKSLFDVGNVVSVFYMDNMITVEKEDPADWDELLPTLAVPIRAAESVAPARLAALHLRRVRGTADVLWAKLGRSWVMGIGPAVGGRRPAGETSPSS